MTSRKRTTRTTSSSSVPDHDVTRFTNRDAEDRYNRISGSAVIQERGMDYQADPLDEDDVYEPIRAAIEANGWERFVDHEAIPQQNVSLVREFYANYPEQNNGRCFVRGRYVPISAEAVNAIFGTTDAGDQGHHPNHFRTWSRNVNHIPWDVVAEALCYPGAQFRYSRSGGRGLSRCQVNRVAKAWLYFVSARLIPSTHFTNVPADRIKLTFGIMRGLTIDIGMEIVQSIGETSRLTTTGGLEHGSFITALCARHRVPTFATDILEKTLPLITYSLVHSYPDPANPADRR